MATRLSRINIIIMRRACLAPRGEETSVSPRAAKNDRVNEVIGRRLRSSWSDFVAEPLPDHIRDLLDRLAGLEKRKSEGPQNKSEGPHNRGGTAMIKNKVVDDQAKRAAAQLCRAEDDLAALKQGRVLAELLDTSEPTAEATDLIAKLRQVVEQRRPAKHDVPI